MKKKFFVVQVVGFPVWQQMQSLIKDFPRGDWSLGGTYLDLIVDDGYIKAGIDKPSESQCPAIFCVGAETKSRFNVTAEQAVEFMKENLRCGVVGEPDGEVGAWMEFEKALTAEGKLWEKIDYLFRVTEASEVAERQIIENYADAIDTALEKTKTALSRWKEEVKKVLART